MAKHRWRAFEGGFRSGGGRFEKGWKGATNLTEQKTRTVSVGRGNLIVKLSSAHIIIFC